MGDALQERVAKLAASLPRFTSQADQRASRMIAREWMTIDLEGFGPVAVYFCPPQSVEDLNDWPRYRGRKVLS